MLIDYYKKFITILPLKNFSPIFDWMRPVEKLSFPIRPSKNQQSLLYIKLISSCQHGSRWTLIYDRKLSFCWKSFCSQAHHCLQVANQCSVWLLVLFFVTKIFAYRCQSQGTIRSRSFFQGLWGNNSTISTTLPVSTLWWRHENDHLLETKPKSHCQDPFWVPIGLFFRSYNHIRRKYLSNSKRPE